MCARAAQSVTTDAASTAGRRLDRERTFDRAPILAAVDTANHFSVSEAQKRLLRDRQPSPKRVIAMALYGNDNDYLSGALENAIIVQREWKGWMLRVYHDESVSADILHMLHHLAVELVPVSAIRGDDHAGLFWRYFVLRDPSVTRFIVRDADARLTHRDRMAVAEWVASDHLFHVMRDHPAHPTEIMGGLWGAVGGFVQSSLLEQLESTTAAIKFNEDQIFLKRYAWPHVRAHTLVHDSYYCDSAELTGAEWRPFPTRRASLSDFVGNQFEASNDYLGLQLPRKCPAACRKDEKWRYC